MQNTSQQPYVVCTAVSFVTNAAAFTVTHANEAYAEGRIEVGTEDKMLRSSWP